jgi:hypothetical protein
MKLLTNLIDSIFQASWKRVGNQKREVDAPMLSTREGPSGLGLNRTFTITEALNGSYITFQLRKYNPNGPDEYRHEVYLVQNGETLIDAISTVLVLTEK